MKAIILAAGLGRRMQPLTRDIHKTLLPIAGKTIIDRLVSSLVEVGVEGIIVVTGYRADEVEQHLRRGFPRVPFQFVRNERYEQTNNIFSTALAFEQADIDDDVLLIESDLVCDTRVLRRAIDSDHPNVALVDRYRSGMDGTVVAVRDGVITEVIPTHLQQGEFSFADKFKTLNIYKFSREFCATTFRPLVTYYARTIDDNCFYELVLGILIYMRQATIAAEVVDDLPWAEVDDPNDLRVAQFTFDPPSRRSLLEQTKGGYWAFDVLDFAYLRNMYFPTAAMYAEMRALLPSLVQNYGSNQSTLDEKLSYALLCRGDRVHVVNGASQAISWLGQRFDSLPAALPEPTFMEWRAAFPQHVTYSDRGGLDTSAVAAATVGAEVVVFVNPNNPTGTQIESSVVHSFAAANPAKTIIVDESFQGFSGDRSLVSLLEDDPLSNVIVVASLSKSMGVPGVRLGYVYTSDAGMHSSLGEWLPIWNVNSLAEHFLELMLKHRESLVDSYARTISDRESFARQLDALPLVDSLLPSTANFVLARLRVTDRSAAKLADMLIQREQIYVKDVSDRLADGMGWFRLAVRLPAENARLCDALDRLSHEVETVTMAANLA